MAIFNTAQFLAGQVPRGLAKCPVVQAKCPCPKQRRDAPAFYFIEAGGTSQRAWPARLQAARKKYGQGPRCYDGKYSQGPKCYDENITGGLCATTEYTNRTVDATTKI